MLVLSTMNFFLLENTYSTRIVWKKKQTWQTTVNELRPLYRLWLCRWGIHDSADLRSRHQHQAHASSDIGETGQRTTGWGDLPRVPYAPCPSPDSNPHAYAYESKLWTMRPPRAPTDYQEGRKDSLNDEFQLCIKRINIWVWSFYITCLERMCFVDYLVLCPVFLRCPSCRHVQRKNRQVKQWKLNHHCRLNNMCYCCACSSSHRNSHPTAKINISHISQSQSTTGARPEQKRISKTWRRRINRDFHHTSWPSQVAERIDGARSTPKMPILHWFLHNHQNSSQVQRDGVSGTHVRNFRWRKDWQGLRADESYSRF